MRWKEECNLSFFTNSPLPCGREGGKRQKERERLAKGMESKRLKNENGEVRVRFQDKHAGLLTESRYPFSLLPQSRERDISNFAPNFEKTVLLP